MPGRSKNGDEYRYNFNNQEIDKEWLGGAISFSARILDRRLGRFLSVDPIAAEYPWNSSFAFAENRVIDGIDLEGAEWKEIKRDLYNAAGYVKDVAVQTAGGVAYVVTHPIAGTKAVVKGIYHGVTQAVKDGGTMGATWGKTFNNAVLGGDSDIDKGAFYEAAHRTGKGIVSGGVGTAATMGFGSALKWLRKADTKPGSGVLKKANPCGCFTARTIVKTKEGDKNIEDVIVGDLVWAYDDSTGNIELKQVLQLHKYTREAIYKIYVNGEIIEATADHPFYVRGNYINTKNLQLGDILTLQSGTTVSIDSIVSIAGTYQVYNFTVDDFHTYFVGNDGILVHNDPCPFNVVDLDDGYVRIKDVSNGDQVAFGAITNGYVEMTIATKGSKVKGGDAFNAIMKELKSWDDVSGVRAIWINKKGLNDNLKQFNENLSKYPTLEEAAMNTFTGTMAKKHGYTKARIDESSIIKNDAGKITTISVYFE